jgi:intergrase/recombinase
VNDDKKAYKVDEVVILIWSMCDGERDEKQITDEFCSKLGESAPKEEIEKAVSDIISQLEKFGLLEKAGAKKVKKPAKKKGK